MIADKGWLKRNLGFDPIEVAPPSETFSFAPAASNNASIEDFQREIIDFDSQSPTDREFLSLTTATGLSRFTEIPWPRGLMPKTSPKPRGGGGGFLPKADVLAATWTVDERHVLSRVLTLEKDSRDDQAIGGHAVMRVGYNNQTQLFKIRNSWGASQGKNGDFFVPYAYLTSGNFAADFWVINAVKD